MRKGTKMEKDLDWIIKLSKLIEKRLSAEQLNMVVDENYTGSMTVGASLRFLEFTAQELKKTSEELEEYKFMYEELCK